MLLCAFMHECVFCARVFTCVYVCFSDENRQNEGETGRFLLELSGFSESLWQPPPPSNPYFCLLGFFVLPRSFDFLPIPLLFFFIICWSPIALHRPIQLSSDCESQLFLNTWTHLFLNSHFQLHSVQLKHVSEVTLVA